MIIWALGVTSDMCETRAQGFIGNTIHFNAISPSQFTIAESNCDQTATSPDFSALLPLPTLLVTVGTGIVASGGLLSIPIEEVGAHAPFALHIHMVCMPT